MKIGDKGLDIIKDSEALRLKAYYATAEEKARGISTIGYGHTKGIQPNDTCNAEQANEWLREDCADAEFAVNTYVTHPLTQNQFDALVSLVFNIGGTNFHTSTLFKRLNAGLIEDAAEQFLVWNKQGGVILGGLVKRRAREKELFLGV